MKFLGFAEPTMEGEEPSFTKQQNLSCSERDSVAWETWGKERWGRKGLFFAKINRLFG